MSLYIAPSPLKLDTTRKKKLSNDNDPHNNNDNSSSEIDPDITRYAHLYVKLLQLFPKSRSGLLVPHPCFSSTSNIHILVDISNIYIGFCKTLESYFNYYFNETKEDSVKGPLATRIRNYLSKHPYAKHNHVLDMSALNLILQRGRSVSTKYLCGSIPNNKGSRQYKIYESMFDRAKNELFDVEIKDRVFQYQVNIGINNNNNNNKNERSNNNDNNNTNKVKEMGVDELLALKIHHIVAKDPERFSVTTTATTSITTVTTTSKDKGINQYGNCPTSGRTNTTQDSSSSSSSSHSNSDNNISTNSTNSNNRNGKEKPKIQKTIVLATGDGNPSAHHNLDFLTSIESALKSGYYVELFSFGESLNSRYKRLTMLYGDKLRIVYLDEFVWELASNDLPQDLKQYLDKRGFL